MCASFSMQGLFLNRLELNASLHNSDQKSPLLWKRGFDYGVYQGEFSSTKSSITSTSINSCNLDNLLSFVRNAFAP